MKKFYIIKYNKKFQKIKNLNFNGYKFYHSLNEKIRQKIREKYYTEFENILKNKSENNNKSCN